MKRSVIWSALLHALVLILAVVGLPRLWESPPPEDAPVVVEVVKVEEETKAEDVVRPKAEEKKPPEPQPPPEPPQARRPPDVPPPPEPPRLRETPEPKVEKVPEAKPEPKPEPKAKPKPKPKPKPKAEPAAPPRQIARVRPRRRPPPSREDFVSSVLRDVAPEERAESRREESEPKPPAPMPERTPVRRAPLDAKATMSEIDAIRRQIEQCWSIPAGARNAENLVVGIRVWVNPDGTVARAQIIDAQRMTRDPYFRSAAETALRAVLNPRCSPLPIPPNKYDQFRVMVLNFNPKEAAGS